MSERGDWTAEDLGLPERDCAELGALLGLAAAPRTPPARLKARVLAGLKRRGGKERPAWLRRAAALSAALAAAALILEVRPGPGAREATLAHGTGDVRVDGRPAFAGQRVASGQTVSVDGGEAVVVFAGGRAAARLSRGAEAVVRGGEAFEVELRKGWLLSAVAPGTPYRVLTEHGRVAALGTDFMLRRQPADTFVCMCRGRLEVAGEFGRTELAAGGHDAWVFTGSRAPHRPAPASMAGHSEGEIRSLRAFLAPL